MAHQRAGEHHSNEIAEYLNLELTLNNNANSPPVTYQYKDGNNIRDTKSSEEKKEDGNQNLEKKGCNIL